MKEYTQEKKDILRNYLLNQLFFDESEELEEELLADEELTREKDAVEFDLIFDFVSGRLSAKDRRLFEENFLVTSENYEKVKSASHSYIYMKSLANQKETGTSTQPKQIPVYPNLGFWSKFGNIFSPQRNIFTFTSLVIIVFSFAIGSYFLIPSYDPGNPNNKGTIAKNDVKSENNTPKPSNSEDEVNNSESKDNQKKPKKTKTPANKDSNLPKKEGLIVRNTKNPIEKPPSNTQNHINKKKRINDKKIPSNDINSNKVAEITSFSEFDETRKSKISGYKAIINKNTKFLRYKRIYSGKESIVESDVIAEIRRGNKLVAKTSCNLENIDSEIFIIWTLSVNKLSDGMYKLTYKFKDKNKDKYLDLYNQTIKFNFKKTMRSK